MPLLTEKIHSQGKAPEWGPGGSTGPHCCGEGSTEACQKEVMSPELRVKNCEQCVKEAKKSIKRLQPQPPEQ